MAQPAHVGHFISTKVASVLLKAAGTIAIGLVLAATAARAADPRLANSVPSQTVGAAKQTMLELYVTSRDAADAMRRFPDIVLIDVRAHADVLSDGLAEPTARNIPLFAPTPAGLIQRFGAAPSRISPDFVAAVERVVGGGPTARNRTIFVICPDGSYSAMAVDQLADQGFLNVYLIVDGIAGSARADANGWRRAGLPWLKVPRPSQLAP